MYYSYYGLGPDGKRRVRGGICQHGKGKQFCKECRGPVEPVRQPVEPVRPLNNTPNPPRAQDFDPRAYYQLLGAAASRELIPTRISPELETFLGVPTGTIITRVEVTRAITRYIRENNLQNPQNGRQIIPDNNFRSLLRLNDDSAVPISLLQRNMNHLFLH